MYNERVGTSLAHALSLPGETGTSLIAVAAAEELRSLSFDEEMSTTELVERLWPAKSARGSDNLLRKKLYKVVLAPTFLPEWRRTVPDERNGKTINRTVWRNASLAPGLASLSKENPLPQATPSALASALLGHARSLSESAENAKALAAAILNQAGMRK